MKEVATYVAYAGLLFVAVNRFFRYRRRVRYHRDCELLRLAAKRFENRGSNG